MPQVAKSRALAAPARRKRVGRVALDHVRNFHRPDFLPLRAQRSASDGLKKSSSRHGCGRCCGARRSSSTRVEEIRFDIIYSQISERTRRVFTVITGIVAHSSFMRFLCPPPTLCQFHEGRAVGLSACADQLDVLGLSDFCRRLHLPLLLAGAPGHSRRNIAPDRPGQDRRLSMPISPFALCVAMIVLLRRTRPADRSLHDRRLDLSICCCRVAISAPPPSRSSTACSTATSCSQFRCSSSPPT